ncbi:MAG: phosphatase [Christensenella sp.]
MKFLVDTHTHTVASGHAYSTLRENAIFAARAGLEAFCCTDHGAAVGVAAPDFILNVLRSVPDIIEGVRLIRGCELNIMDYEGNVDVAERYINLSEFLIASMHDIVIETGTVEENTAALAGALGKKYVDVVGHPGNPHYPVNIEEVVDAAHKYNKLIEINNHSFTFRKGSTSRCTEYIRLCKEKGVRITVSSDAHSCYNIGGFDEAAAALEEAAFPQELIVSRNLKTFNEYLDERKMRIKE